MGMKNDAIHGKSKVQTKEIPRNGLTNYITEWQWNDIITTWYARVDEIYQLIVEHLSNPLRSRGPAPQISDSEVITVSLIIETFFQGHEAL